jgi:hypothetical protein
LSGGCAIGEERGQAERASDTSVDVIAVLNANAGGVLGTVLR